LLQHFDRFIFERVTGLFYYINGTFCKRNSSHILNRISTDFVCLIITTCRFAYDRGRLNRIGGVMVNMVASNTTYCGSPVK